MEIVQDQDQWCRGRHPAEEVEDRAEQQVLLGLGIDVVTGGEVDPGRELGERAARARLRASTCSRSSSIGAWRQR